MALPGLVATRNLADVTDREKAWDNIGNNIEYSISGITTSGVIVKGRDILALKGVRNTSTRDFIFIKGLASAAQPRIADAAATVVSGTVLRDNALLKASPTSVDNYSIARGFLDASSLQVNGVQVASISGSPFSGDTATVPVSIATLSTPTNFRFAQPMPSGTLTTGDRAIPIETSSFILYAKAGQS